MATTKDARRKLALACRRARKFTLTESTSNKCIVSVATNKTSTKPAKLTHCTPVLRHFFNQKLAIQTKRAFKLKVPSRHYWISCCYCCCLHLATCIDSLCLQVWDMIFFDLLHFIHVRVVEVCGEQSGVHNNKHLAVVASNRLVVVHCRLAEKVTELELQLHNKRRSFLKKSKKCHPQVQWEKQRLREQCQLILVSLRRKRLQDWAQIINHMLEMVRVRLETTKAPQMVVVAVDWSIG